MEKKVETVMVNKKSLKIPKGLHIHKSKMDGQHNGQKKKDKKINNDLQNITHKICKFVFNVQ